MLKRITRPLTVAALTVAAVTGASLIAASTPAPAAAAAAHRPRHICALLETGKRPTQGDESGNVPIVVCVTPAFRDGSYRCVTVPRNALSQVLDEAGVQINCVFVPNRI
jgi:hypothetical protein